VIKRYIYIFSFIYVYKDSCAKVFVLKKVTIISYCEFNRNWKGLHAQTKEEATVRRGGSSGKRNRRR